MSPTPTTPRTIRIRVGLIENRWSAAFRPLRIAPFKRIHEIGNVGHRPFVLSGREEGSPVSPGFRAKVPVD